MAPFSTSGVNDCLRRSAVILSLAGGGSQIASEAAVLPLRASCGTEISNPLPSSGESGANLSLARIRLSRSRSRGFPRLSGPERAVWVGRDTRARNIWPKGGDISVAPYSSTARSVMRSATMPRIISRMRDPP
jgi:hypothetical protein